jgi:hypothetical protein
MEQPLNTLKALRLPGMATAFEEQQTNATVTSLSFDDRFSLLVDCEQTAVSPKRDRDFTKSVTV